MSGPGFGEVSSLRPSTIDEKGLFRHAYHIAELSRPFEAAIGSSRKELARNIIQIKVMALFLVIDIALQVRQSRLNGLFDQDRHE